MVPRAGELVSRSEPAAEEGSAGVEWERGPGLLFLRRMESLVSGASLGFQVQFLAGSWGDGEGSLVCKHKPDAHNSVGGGGGSLAGAVSGSGELI